MRRANILWLSLLAAGCTADPPSGFGVNITIDASQLTSADRGRISAVALSVPADGNYTTTVDVHDVIGGSSVHAHYTPGVKTGTLTFWAQANDTGGAFVAAGNSGPVELALGAVPAIIVLSTEMPLPPDGGGVDGGSDGSVLRQKGDPCTDPSECGSAGGCVDGYCCDSACTDSCKACNVAGMLGTCTIVPNGTPPATGHPACGPDDKSTCGKDGTCDGKGACRLWPLNTQCKPSSCNASSNNVTAAATCDGNGTCVTPSAITCAPYVCQDANVCYASCTTGGNQCSSGNVCNNNSCGLKGNGATCTTNAECSSGFCIDTVCCNSACGGTCQTCNQATSLGTCKSVPSAQDPRNDCPTGTGANATCAPGKCDGAGHCNLAAASTQCANPTCMTGNATAAGTCNATGTCQIPSSTPCSPYVCGATACANPCGADTDCISGYYCSAGMCIAQKAPGGACTSVNQCQAGLYCAPEGVCCNAPCTSACQVCNSAGSCVPVPANQQPRTGHPACTGGGTAPCGGYCDGVDAGCFYPTTQCWAASCGCFSGHCQASVAVDCSNGTCPNPVVVSCNGFFCDSTMTACQQTCTSSSGCDLNHCCHSIFTGACFWSCQPTGGTCSTNLSCGG